jgi:hypothetical protein
LRRWKRKWSGICDWPRKTEKRGRKKSSGGGPPEGGRYAVLADGFFGTEKEGHQDLDGDAAAAVVEFLDANDLAEGFLIDGAGSVGVGKGDEEAETFFVTRIFGDEVDAVESGVFGWEDFVEIGEAGFGRAYTDDTWNLEAAFAAAFRCFQVWHILLCA